MVVGVSLQSHLFVLIRSVIMMAQCFERIIGYRANLNICEFVHRCVDGSVSLVSMMVHVDSFRVIP